LLYNFNLLIKEESLGAKLLLTIEDILFTSSSEKILSIFLVNSLNLEGDILNI